MILLKNCRLIPELTEGYEKRKGDVLINGETILQIAEPDEIRDFDGEIIDLQGCTLLPGFFDLHAHLYLSELNLAAIDNKDAVETSFDTYAFSREYLRQGYTTIRDAGCPYHVTKGLMKARKKGIINVPDIISAGHAITPTETGNDEYKIMYEVADGADGFRRAARKQLEAGNIDKNSSIPIYRQIESSLKKKILNNELPFGTKLPSERRLAEFLDIHRNTVVKAYKLLTDQELVSCTLEHRKGYFVIFGSDCKMQQDSRSARNKAVFRYSYTSGTLEKIFDDIYTASFQKKYISFGGHVMPSELILVDQIRDVMNRTMEAHGADALSYCAAKGNPILRRELSVQLEKEGIHAKETEIVIVNETTQALDFVSGCLAAPNDCIVSEAPIMPDAYGLFRRNGLKVILAEMEEDGGNLIQLENIFKKYRPGFFHTMPDYHSVTGARMSLQKRKQLIELAYRCSVPILEERWYSGISFTEEELPSLFALDKYKNVIAIDSAFTKFYYGAKIAYMLAPAGMAEKIGRHVSGSQTHLQNLEQLMFSEYLRQGYSVMQKDQMREYYRRKCRVMEREMEILREGGTEWKRPDGGLGFWCRLPEGIHDMHLYEKLRKRGVLICPGKLFFPEGNAQASYMRLSFSNVSDENVKKGIIQIKHEIDRQKKE